MSKSTRFVVVLLLVFWTLVVGLADFFVLRATARQFFARNDETTPGRIVASNVRQFALLHSGIKIEYAYEVAGKKYVGHMYRYDEAQVTLDGMEVKRRFPQGSETVVHYNSRDPADSVLSVGVEGSDLMLLLFATPISVAILLLWRWLIFSLLERRGRREAGGLRVARQDAVVRVRLAEVTTVAAALYGLGGSSFGATFPVVVMNGLSPGTEPMVFVWVMVLSVTLLAGVWQGCRIALGQFDLIIDTTARTLTLPATCGRTRRRVVSRGEMTGMVLRRRASKLTSGTHYSYLPALARRSERSGGELEHFSPWGWTEERARGFAEWICGELGLEFKGVEEEAGEAA